MIRLTFFRYNDEHNTTEHHRDILISGLLLGNESGDLIAHYDPDTNQWTHATTGDNFTDITIDTDPKDDS